MISPSLYKTIADLVDYTQDRGRYIVNNVSQMSTDLGNSEIDSENIHRQLLENTINATAGVLIDNHRKVTREMVNFVKALQNHVNRNYGDINDFLSTNSTQVRPTFADISASVGYPIDAENIENIS
jgi:hypothetical protein